MNAWFVAQLPYIVVVSIIFVAILIVVTIVMVMRLRVLRRQIDALTAGANGVALEEIIVDNARKLAQLDTEMQEFYHIASTVHALAHRGIHRTGFLRFNPFKDLGGDQSFALALLDGKADGVVISSLHTREGTRVYAKSVVDGDAAQHPFSDEEKSVIATAMTDSQVVSEQVTSAITDLEAKNKKK